MENKVKVYTLFSSSAGNCTFVSDGETDFLIDAGCNMKRVKESLGRLGASLSDISDIFVTHEHTDHISAIKCICKNSDITVHAAYPTSERIEAANVRSYKEGYSVNLGGFTVTSFSLSHDSLCCVGYTVKHESGTKFASLTDTGYVTEEAKNALAGCTSIILESNYDDEKLLSGFYPYETKMRIRSKKGHLSNAQAAEFLPYLYGVGVRNVLLAHISKENNTPELALAAANDAAIKYGLSGLTVRCAGRNENTRLI